MLNVRIIINIIIIKSDYYSKFGNILAIGHKK